MKTQIEIEEAAVHALRIRAQEVGRRKGNTIPSNDNEALMLLLGQDAGWKKHYDAAQGAYSGGTK